MKKSNFDSLMERYLSGKATAHERLKIEAWLEVMKTERTTDLEFTNDDQERLFKKITGEDSSVDDVIAMYPKQSRTKRLFSKQWIQIAASVAILLSVSFIVWHVVSDSAPLYVLGSSVKEKVILNDGTIVWLKTGSKFAYYEKEDGTRHARLTGEGLFEVAKIPNSSFTIECDKISVGVVGTSFSLKTGPEQIELNLLTGKVKLTSAQDSTGVSVEPNQKVIYTTAGEINRATLDQREVTSLTEDTEYNMSFTGAAMDEVIKSIARKFDVTITVSDENLNNCHISADFTDNSLENTLTILSDMLHISYTVNGKNIRLSGKGC